MREILFRGKRADNGEWVYGSPIFQDNYALIRFWNSEEFNYEEYLVMPESITEFTGVADKNGKKIFEGDIIKSCEYDDIYLVKYCADDNYPAFDVVPEMNVECNGLSHLHIVEGIEVIGNIHDNPELLKGE